MTESTTAAPACHAIMSNVLMVGRCDRDTHHKLFSAGRRAAVLAAPQRVRDPRKARTLPCFSGVPPTGPVGLGGVSDVLFRACVSCGGRARRAAQQRTSGGRRAAAGPRWVPLLSRPPLLPNHRAAGLNLPAITTRLRPVSGRRRLPFGCRSSWRAPADL